MRLSSVALNIALIYFFAIGFLNLYIASQIMVGAKTIVLTAAALDLIVAGIYAAALYTVGAGNLHKALILSAIPIILMYPLVAIALIDTGFNIMYVITLAIVTLPPLFIKAETSL